MIRRLKLLTLALLPMLAFSQSPEEDEVKLESALEWLESKLSYIYYDNTGEQWWNNTFYVNDNLEVTIKHIASDRPNTGYIKDKTYTIRTFQLKDINPNSLKITDIKESRGRIVKGQMLELRTFDFQDLIHKSINKRRASSTSFLFLSFPETLIDSLSNYAEVVKSKFEEAILASTQVYSSNKETNLEAVLNILTGTFESENGTKWIAKGVKANVLQLDRGNEFIEYFGFDSGLDAFYLLSISNQGIEKQHFKFKEDTRIHLSDHDGNDSLLIKTKHSFILNGEVYSRQ